MTAKTLEPVTTVLIGEVAENGFATLSSLMLNALVKAATDGRSLAPASFGAEFTVAAFPAGAVTCTAGVERATRTLVFVAAEARDEAGARLGVASGVFKVIV